MADKDKLFQDACEVLHAAKLYTTPAGLIGRRVTGRIESTIFCAFITSCTVAKGAMTLELSLVQYDNRKVRALIYAGPDDQWLLQFQNSTLEVAEVEFSSA